MMCLELFNAADGEIELGVFEEGEASFRLDEQYAARQEWILRFLADAIQSHGAFRRPKGNVVLLASLHDSLGRSSVLHTAATASDLRSKGIPLLELNGLEHGSGVDRLMLQRAARRTSPSPRPSSPSCPQGAPGAGCGRCRRRARCDVCLCGVCCMLGEGGSRGRVRVPSRRVDFFAGVCCLV